MDPAFSLLSRKAKIKKGIFFLSSNGILEDT